MQQVCNKDIDMYRTFFSRDTGECPFLCLNLINRIYKLLYIKVCIYFFCECHCTRMTYNFFNNCLVNTSFLQSVRPLYNHRLEATLQNGEKLVITRNYIEPLKEKLKGANV